ncbi:tumor necrosis factor receptor superfamily member wengen [Haematobia irritans]|uniref:tumor necrosis factor receptor superfamily member wengen n=1 Tax=Haematobia irritans TaxID=7368 RepID=UPI003F501390
MNLNIPAHSLKPPKISEALLSPTQHHQHHHPNLNHTSSNRVSSRSIANTTTTILTTHPNSTFSGSRARSRDGVDSHTTEYPKKSSCKNYPDDEDDGDSELLSTYNHTQMTTKSTKSMDPTRRCWSSWWSQLKPSTAACVTFLLLSTTCSLCSASLCDPQSWWDPYKDKCIPCTVCQGDMIPLRPCQMHRDTVCGSIYDLKIDWVVLSKTEPNWKERRKFDGSDYGLDHHQLTAEQLQQLQDENDPLDWQTAALFLAVLACLLFFIVAACILVHHMRQWRRMERRLDQDVEELSTKLMAKLAEVQSLEGGTFFIGNADALRIPSSATTQTTAGTGFHQPQHVMLPEKSDKHHNHLQVNHLHHPHHHHQQQQQQHLLHPNDHRIFNTTTMKSGNVYIEDGNGTGSKC